jgi:hypothetical protein
MFHLVSSSRCDATNILLLGTELGLNSLSCPLRLVWNTPNEYYRINIIHIARDSIVPCSSVHPADTIKQFERGLVMMKGSCPSRYHQTGRDLERPCADKRFLLHVPGRFY